LSKTAQIRVYIFLKEKQMTDHACQQKDAILKIFNGIDTINKNLAEINERQALTNQILLGNGVKGLCERFNDLENEVKNIKDQLSEKEKNEIAEKAQKTGAENVKKMLWTAFGIGMAFLVDKGTLFVHEFYKLLPHK
jgi:hypothetical protein